MESFSFYSINKHTARKRPRWNHYRGTVTVAAWKWTHNELTSTATSQCSQDAGRPALSR